ncbi:hypothetical protein [Ereboglobus luteus]|uniref:Uncharacterized protein n=1 Tax=Ereboglobus luteus TaxID=1796921 RepID=A0A2U8E5I4_9BACT|nr:hypothetical protein [Ereboglobus luteus]AWI10025.1 hypothetical protein CKA38_12870 [Ereboglobus luteus]
MYKEHLDRLEDEYKKIAARVEEVRKKKPVIQKATEAKLAYVKNYKARDELVVGEYFKPAVFALSESTLAKNKSLLSFCTAKEFTQCALSGQKPRVDAELAKIQRTAAAKLNDLKAGIAALGKLQAKKMKRDAARDAVQEAIFAISDSILIMNDGLQAQLRYWAGRCAEIYRDDAPAKNAHNNGKVAKIAAALGTALNDFAQQISKSETALNQS